MKSVEELADEVERLEEYLRSASLEIRRLNQVIQDHVTRSSNFVISNYKEPEAVTVIESEIMVTCVRMEPMMFEAVLAESLGGWSRDHKAAFEHHVREGFSASAAEAIAKSVWQ